MSEAGLQGVEPPEGDPTAAAIAEGIGDNVSDVSPEEVPMAPVKVEEESSDDEEETGPTKEEVAAATEREEKRRAALASRQHAGISAMKFDLSSLVAAKMEVKTPTLAGQLAAILERIAGLEDGQDKLLNSGVRTLLSVASSTLMETREMTYLTLYLVSRRPIRRRARLSLLPHWRRKSWCRKRQSRLALLTLTLTLTLTLILTLTLTLTLTLHP